MIVTRAPGDAASTHLLPNWQVDLHPDCTYSLIYTHCMPNKDIALVNAPSWVTLVDDALNFKVEPDASVTGTF